ncbi:hypothetical protein ACFVSS_25035, partial [Peribacillus butanolivorans]|uniref:hypothetical protein n=1 Tax=Peribacillus butanolivorans TaxID=421767 RepID=UPI0036DC3B69
ECLEWKSTFEFLQPLKKTVDKLDFHRVCLQSEPGHVDRAIYFAVWKNMMNDFSNNMKILLS